MRRAASGSVLLPVYSSTTTWAFAPVAPNELTPALRTPPHVHGSVVRWSRNGDPSRFSSGFTVSACSVGTSVRWCSCSTAFVSPEIPAAPSAWPMLDFTDPSEQLPGSAVSPNAVTSARNSIGSPSEVPVPCASSTPTVAGSMPASANASVSTAACATGFGTLNPLAAPPWFTALPVMTA
ncbi:hypothetical protein SAXI111661_20080 [Saccharomonospora xinjiangensis]